MSKLPIGPDLPNAAATEATSLPRTETACLKGHEGPIFAVRFNTTGTYCLSCGKDRTIRLWNPHKGIPIKSYTGHGYDVRDVAVSSDNSKLASCGGDRQIFLWDVASGRIIRKFRGHDGVVNSVCYGPEDGVLVTGGYDQAVRIWDCRSRSFDAIQSMKPFADSVTSVAVTDNAGIVASSVDGTIRRFDVRFGSCYTDTVHHAVASMALSHDGNCLLGACLDSCMRLLDCQSGELLAQYVGHQHEGSKLDCCLTPSDAHVICGSEDGRVCFWDLVEEDLVQTIQAHQAAITSVAMHPGGDCLLTASTDGSIKVWR